MLKFYKTKIISLNLTGFIIKEEIFIFLINIYNKTSNIIYQTLSFPMCLTWNIFKQLMPDGNLLKNLIKCNSVVIVINVLSN